METSESKSTRQLAEIRHWVEERKGKPARIRKEGQKRGEGVLRIDFPGYTSLDDLEMISWGEWYDIFMKKHLAFLYQEKTKEGGESRFFKLVAVE